MSFWLFVSIFELFIIFILSFYVYLFAKRILETEEKIDSAMEVLEEKYKSISAILDRPVFFDSVEVRQVINDIYKCQESIYQIMLTVGNAVEIEEKNEEINERKEKDEEGE